MELANTNQVSREKSSPIREIHFGLQEHGKRLDHIFQSLTIVGNKLSDTSGNLNEAPKEPRKDVELPPPGIVTDLQRDVIGLSELITRIEKEVRKIEGII